MMWSASGLFFVAAGAMVFFFCLGFSLWKALSVSQTCLYWHASLCMILFGGIIVTIAGSRVDVWAAAINVSYAMLSVGIFMTLGGIVYLALHRLLFYRAG